MMPPALRRLALSCLVLPWLAACTGLLPENGELPETYRLTPPAVSAAGPVAGVGSGPSLVVGEPAAAAGLGTDRIAVWQDPQRLQYYEGARWVEEAPEMLHAALIEAFRSSGAFSAVGARSVAIDPDYRLRTRLTAFEAGYPGGAVLPTVTVTLAADLVREPGRDVVASRTFSREARPTAEDVASVVDAFDRAGDAVLADVVRWAVAATAQRAGA